MKSLGIGINLNVLEILSKYLPKAEALKAIEELMIEEYRVRQELKETIIREFKSVYEPQFTVPGAEHLPANTIERIRSKYDFQFILDTPMEDIEFIGVPEEYKNGN